MFMKEYFFLAYIQYIIKIIPIICNNDTENTDRDMKYILKSMERAEDRVCGRTEMEILSARILTFVVNFLSLQPCMSRSKSLKHFVKLCTNC